MAVKDVPTVHVEIQDVTQESFMKIRFCTRVTFHLDSFRFRAMKKDLTVK